MSDYQEIYTQDDGAFVVYYDPQEVAGLPIGIFASFDPEAEAASADVAVWFEPEQAARLVGALFAALNLGTAVTNVANVTQEGRTLNEQLLALAIANDLSVTFTYAKGEGQILETRTLEPEAVNEVKGNKIVIGYDVDRDDVRAYRLDRIKGRVSIR